MHTTIRNGGNSVKRKLLLLMLTVIVLLSGCDIAAPAHSNATSSNVNDMPVSSILVSSEPVATTPIGEDDNLPTLEENFAQITKTNRKRGTDGEKSACDYIYNQLVNYGYSATVQEFDIFDVTIEQMAKADYFEMNPLNASPISKGYNVIADMNYDKNKKTVIVSPHYDTTTDSVGALDNATGTVAILEAAKKLRKQHFDYNLRFIFFSSEEYRFYGSRSYLNSLSQDELSHIHGCFNVDMVGSKDCRKTIVLCPVLEENWITTNYRKVDEKFEFRQGGSSDNIPFSKKGIPAVHFTTVDIRDDKFNYDLLKKEVNVNSVSIENLQLDTDLIVEFINNISLYE